MPPGRQFMHAPLLRPQLSTLRPTSPAVTRARALGEHIERAALAQPVRAAHPHGRIIGGLSGVLWSRATGHANKLWKMNSRPARVERVSVKHPLLGQASRPVPAGTPAARSTRHTALRRRPGTQQQLLRARPPASHRARFPLVAAASRPMPAHVPRRSQARPAGGLRQTRSLAGPHPHAGAHSPHPSAPQQPAPQR